MIGVLSIHGLGHFQGLSESSGFRSCAIPGQAPTLTHWQGFRCFRAQGKCFACSLSRPTFQKETYRLLTQPQSRCPTNISKRKWPGYPEECNGWARTTRKREVSEAFAKSPPIWSTAVQTHGGASMGLLW